MTTSETKTKVKTWTPPTYETSEERIAHIAHRWNTQYNYDAEYRARGWSDAEIEAGNKLGRAREDQWLKWREHYGSPEYGGWDVDPRDGVRKPRQEFIELIVEKGAHQGEYAL